MDPSPIPPPPVQPPSPAVVPGEAGTKEGSPPPPTKSNNLLLISLVILAILLSFGTAAFISYQNVQQKNQVAQTKPTLTPNPTANLSRDEVPRDWKTYINTEIGFSLKYPQEWIQQESVSAPRIASFDTKSGTPGEFFIAYLKNISSLSQWLLDNHAGEIINTVSINNNQFTVIKGGSLNVSREYAIKVGANNYLRLVVEPFPNSIITDKVLNQILSTFKFVDQTHVDASSWKTYTNSQYGFSFQYPAAWTAGKPAPEDVNALVTITADEQIGGGIEPIMYYIRVNKSSLPSKQTYPDLKQVQKFSGFNSVYITEQELSRSGMLSYFFSKDGVTFIEISLEPYSTQNPFTKQSQYVSTFNQILSTFTFTDQNTTEDKIYHDSQNSYSFSYPSTWNIIPSIPENFLYHDFSQKPDYINYFNSSEGLNWWLTGKMFVGQCRGPVLQNNQDPNQIIALEIFPVANEGSFCWSSGYFFAENKWKVEEKYIYPITKDNSGKSVTPEWKGDFFKSQKIGQNSRLMAFGGLANRETFTFKGDDVLTKIISTFKFTN